MTNKDCAEHILMIYESYRKHYGTNTLFREAVIRAIGMLMNGDQHDVVPLADEDTCDLPRFNAFDYVR